MLQLQHTHTIIQHIDNYKLSKYLYTRGHQLLPNLVHLT